eukprot:gene27060-32695_t
MFFCADEEASGLTGKLSRIILVQIPAFWRKVIISICGKSAFSSIYSIYDYTVNKRNPIMQGMYLVIINAAFLSWIILVSPEVPMQYVDSFHIPLSYAWVAIAQFTFYLACATSPGQLTNDTVAAHNHTTYDGLMYVSGTFCKTCKVPKIARSKHCSLCGTLPLFNVHINTERLNQCVGELNYRYFLLFLLANASFFFYGAYVMVMVMFSEIEQKRLMHTVFVNRTTGEEFAPTMIMVALYLIGEQTTAFIILALAIVMGIAVSCFLFYHLYLVYKGTTTNESVKWSSIQGAHKSLVEAHKKYLERKQKGEISSDPSQASNSTDSATNSDGKLEDSKAEDKTGNEGSKHEEGDGVGGVQRLDEVVGCLPPGFFFNEPKGYKKQCVRAIIEQLEAAGAERMPDLLEEDPGEKPRNIYDVGFFKNMWRIVFPPALPKLRELERSKQKVE